MPNDPIVRWENEGGAVLPVSVEPHQRLLVNGAFAASQAAWRRRPPRPALAVLSGSG
jgi:hypothetical protein